MVVSRYKSRIWTTDKKKTRFSTANGIPIYLPSLLADACFQVSHV